jgi:CO/xanthine dehydrogenase FAD-binding subunit
MRAYLRSYEMRPARSIDEALTLLSHPPGVWRPFAGGTDVMVLLAAGSLRQQQFVNVWGIDELRQIEVRDEGVRVGALTTFTDVQRHDVLRREFPLLVSAAVEVGGIANQNRATIGGNIANASPAADSPPALLVYDAEVELASVRGRRQIPYAQFHTGYKQMDLAADELIVSIWLPRRGDAWQQQYRKVGARRAQAISKVCFAGAARMESGRISDVRLAFASLAPTVVRATRTESLLRDRELTRSIVADAVESLRSELKPIDDIRSTARYRARVAENVFEDFLGLLGFPIRKNNQ